LGGRGKFKKVYRGEKLGDINLHFGSIRKRGRFRMGQGRRFTSPYGDRGREIERTKIRVDGPEELQSLIGRGGGKNTGVCKIWNLSLLEKKSLKGRGEKQRKGEKKG